MTKYRAIIPTCFLLASGCALFDNEEMATETPAVSVAVIESVPVPPAPAVVTAVPQFEEPPTVAPRALTSNDVRRLQARLHEIGLDPGPVDGIAGARTKAAYVRLHTGCSKVGPLIDNLNAPVAEAQGFSANRTGYKLPSREETRHIQTQLRSAGFDPGPVDGIFGNRTKTMVSRLQSGCPMAKEFEGMLDDSLRIVANEAAVAQPTAEPLSSGATVGGLQRSDGDKQPAVVEPVRAREEVRILQLQLRDAGFDPGPFDGVMGPRTRAALAQYETSQRGKKIKTRLTTTSAAEQY